MKKCIYCGEKAGTKEHIPPRLLYEMPFPKNLFTRRACETCNGSFAEDEEYFRFVLAQIRGSEFLDKKVEEGGIVDKVLQQSKKFDQDLIDSLKVVDGKVYMNPEVDRLKRIFHKIAFGLYIKEYEAIPEYNSITSIQVCPGTIPEGIINKYPLKDWIIVQEDIFSYKFIDEETHYCIINFYNALWGISIVPERNKS